MSCVVWMTCSADKQKPPCAFCPMLYGWHLMLISKTTVCIMSCAVWMTSGADKQNHWAHYVLYCMDDMWCWQAKTTLCILSYVVWMTSDADKWNHCVHYVLCCMDDIWCWQAKPLCALCHGLYCASPCSCKRNSSVLIISLMVCHLGTIKPLCALCPVASIIHYIITHISIMYGI